MYMYIHIHVYIPIQMFRRINYFSLRTQACLGSHTHMIVADVRLIGKQDAHWKQHPMKGKSTMQEFLGTPNTSTKKEASVIWPPNRKGGLQIRNPYFRYTKQIWISEINWCFSADEVVADEVGRWRSGMLTKWVADEVVGWRSGWLTKWSLTKWSADEVVCCPPLHTKNFECNPILNIIA